MRKFTRSVLRSYLFALSGAAVAAVLFRTWILEPYRVPHSRMTPEILPGDTLLVWKPGYDWAKRPPQPGEILLVRADGSDSKVNLAKVVSIQATRVRVSENSGPVQDREITPEDVLGKAWRVWLSVEPRHDVDAGSWLSRLRFERFFKRVES